MHRRWVEHWKAVVALLALTTATPAFGISCTTQSQMTNPQRIALEQGALELAADVQQGNTAAVRQQTIPPVASDFSGIANSIQGTGPDIAQAKLTVDSLYLLNAGDLKSAGEAQFFCGLPNSELTVEITIPNLPPGRYALAVVHATGVKHPQQISMILANEGLGAYEWKLAGFFTRPMTMGGQSGLWFWKQARVYAEKKENWNAWFYYETAMFLLDPVDFLTSPNLQKLDREAARVRPGGLPGAQPMTLAADGQTYAITSLHTGDFSGDLDMVVTYDASGSQDPVAERAQVTAVMRTLLAAHPELKQAFHGIWVHAARLNSPAAFALELPMDQIESSDSSPQTTK